MNKAKEKVANKIMIQTKLAAYPGMECSNNFSDDFWLDVREKFYSMLAYYSSVPIKVDINKLNWNDFATLSNDYFGQSYPVIMIDFPWPEAANFGKRKPTYGLMNEDDMLSIPLRKIQKAGYIFIWVIRSRNKWGYHYAEDVHGY